MQQGCTGNVPVDAAHSMVRFRLAAGYL